MKLKYHLFLVRHCILFQHLPLNLKNSFEKSTYVNDRGEYPAQQDKTGKSKVTQINFEFNSGDRITLEKHHNKYLTDLLQKYINLAKENITHNIILLDSFEYAIKSKNHTLKKY